MYSLQNKLSILFLLVIIFVESANGIDCLHALNYTLFNQTNGGKPPMFVLTAEEKKCDLENVHCFTVDFETENGRGFYKGCTSKYNTSEQCNEENKKFKQKDKTTILDEIRGEKSGIFKNLTKISNCRLCNDSKEKQCNAGILCHHGVNQSFGLFEKKEMISKMTVTQCNDDEQCMKLECPNEYTSGVYKGCAPKMITPINETVEYTTELCAKQFTCKMKVLVDDELDKKKSKPPNSVCNLCHGKNMCNGGEQPLPIKFAGLGGLLFIAGGIVLFQQKLQHLLMVK